MMNDMLNKVLVITLSIVAFVNSAMAESSGESFRPTEALEQFINSPAFFVVIAGLGVAAGVWYMKRGQDDHFEPESLEDKVEDRFRDVMSVFGSYNNIQLRYGEFKEVGVIRSGLRYSYNRKVPKEDDSRPEDKTENDRKWKMEKEDYHVFITRPRFWKSPALYLAWYLVDVSMGLGIFERIVNVPSESLERADHIYIDKELDFASYGGVYTDKTDRGFEAVEERALIDLLEDTTKTYVSLGEHINFLNTQFSQGIQQMREKYKQERNKFQSRSDAAIE